MDLDGTMAFYEKFSFSRIGNMLDGVKETIDLLRSEGYNPECWTARIPKSIVRAWLKKNGIDMQISPIEKPSNVVLIVDDRAFRSSGAGLDPAAVFQAINPEWKQKKLGVKK